MLLYFIVFNILSMASLVEVAVVGCKMFGRVSLRSAPVAVGLSIKLNETAEKGFLLLVEEVLKIGNY